MPLTILVVGHVDDDAHEYVVAKYEPRRYDEAVFCEFKIKLK